jgi:SAM-dependent methyltransferase
VIDIGSFTGMSTIVLGRHFPAVMGLEIEPEFVRVANLLATSLAATATFRAVDAARTGMSSESIDAAVMTATLGYTPDPVALVQEVARVLRPEGVFIEFIYHYPVRTPEVQRRVRAAVSSYVRVASLAQQVDTIEATGLRLERAQRFTRSKPDEAHISAIRRYVQDRERCHNPNLSEAEVAEFSLLFDRFVGRERLDDAEPVVYMCAFRKPPQYDCHEDEP